MIVEGLKGILAVLDIRLFEVAGTTITLATIVALILIIIASLWVSRLLERGVTRVFRARGVTEEGTIGITTRLIHYLTLFVGIGIALHTLGLNLTALFAAGALVAVGIGFATQNITENFVSGIILLLERTIKPGDVLEVDGTMIRVRHMGIRSTVARTLEDEDLIIPNSILVKSTVKNYTLRDTEYRLRAMVGVIYGSDMQLVRSTLEKVAMELPWKSIQREPRVLLRDFGSSSVDFEVSVWINDPWTSQGRRSELREAIWGAFQKTGIVIAFPQVDVHFDRSINHYVETLRRTG